MFLKKSETHRHHLGTRLSLYLLAAVGVYALGAGVHAKCSAMMQGCKCMMQKIKKEPTNQKSYSECSEM